MLFNNDWDDILKDEIHKEYFMTILYELRELYKTKDIFPPQKQVFNDANNAYKTAGLSANQYMENVTSFSASLLSSLGGNTKKSAQVADMAMVDIANKITITAKSSIKVNPFLFSFILSILS